MMSVVVVDDDDVCVTVIVRDIIMRYGIARGGRAAAVLARFSKSRASRRLRLIQASVRSTIQRLATTTKPSALLGRLTISTRQQPVLRAVCRTRFVATAVVLLLQVQQEQEEVMVEQEDRLT